MSGFRLTCGCFLDIRVSQPGSHREKPIVDVQSFHHCEQHPNGTLGYVKALVSLSGNIFRAWPDCVVFDPMFIPERSPK